MIAEPFTIGAFGLEVGFQLPLVLIELPPKVKPDVEVRDGAVNKRVVACEKEVCGFTATVTVLYGFLLLRMTSVEPSGCSIA